MEPKPGTKVRLLQTSYLYFQAPGEIGTIIESKYTNDPDTDWCRVQFPNRTNAYRFRGKTDLELAEKWTYKKVGELTPKDLEDEQPTSCVYKDGIVLLLPKKFCDSFEGKEVYITRQEINFHWGWSATNHFNFIEKDWRGYGYHNEENFIDDLLQAIVIANGEPLTETKEKTIFEKAIMEKEKIEQEKIDLKESRRRYAEKCTKRLKNKKQEYEEKIKSDEEEMKKISRRLVELNRNIDENKRMIFGLDDKENHLERYEKEYDKLLELPLVNKVLVKENTITVFTDTIYLPYEGEIYEMGKYQINFEERRVRIINERPIFDPHHGNQGEWFHHPHVFEKDGSNTCLGNITVGIRELVGKYEYAIATQVLIDFLHTCKYPHYLQRNWKPMKGEEALWA